MRGAGVQRESPQAATERPTSVVKRVSEKLDVARLLAGRPQVAAAGAQLVFPAADRIGATERRSSFINRASGGRRARRRSCTRALLSPQQVVDLSQGHAEQALQSFRSVGRFRVLVCGGDGTVGWVLSLLDTAGLEYTPPVAILPLGTGNDLARALGWGGRHPGRGFISLLEDVDSAQVALLDRWTVGFTDARVPPLARLMKSTASRRPIAARAHARRARHHAELPPVGVAARSHSSGTRASGRPSALHLSLPNGHYMMRAQQLFRKDFAGHCGLAVVADGRQLSSILRRASSSST